MYFKVEHSLNYDNYRAVIDSPDLPVCKILKDGKSNPFIRSLIDALRPLAPEILEICSRSGRLSAWNVTFHGSPILEIWPTGNYKTTLKFFDSMDDNIANISYTASVF